MPVSGVVRLSQCALVPVLEAHEREGHVLARPPQAAAPAGGGERLHAGDLLDALVEFVDHGDRLVEGLALRQTAVHGDVAAVLLREEGGGHLAGGPPEKRAHAAEEEEREDALPHEAAHEEEVGRAREVQQPVERREHARRALGRRLEDVGAEDGREDDRHDGGEHERHAHRHRELHVHHPHHARVVRERQVAGERDERGGDDRAGDLLHRLRRGLLRRQLLAQHERLRVLHHHDRVVHERADHEDEAEHREHVQREPERVEDGERAEERDRNGERGDQRGADVLQEEVRDQHHEGEGDAEREVRLLQEHARERGRVVRQHAHHAGRHALDPLVDFVLHALGGLDGVRLGRLVDAERHRRVFVEAGADRVALAAELHARDVLHEHLRAGVGVRAHDDVLELLLRLEAPLDVQLEAQVLVRVLAAHGAGGGLDVLALDRALDLGDGDVEARELDRVEPDAHRVRAPARLHERHAVHARDAVRHLLLHEVREVHEVHLAPVGHEHVHDHAVLGALTHDDAVLRDLARELRLRALHGVLHVHERDVGGRAGAEDHVAVVEALVVAVRLVVPHVVHAVDLVLDHGAHALVQHLGARARVARGDGDRDGRDVRVLRHRHAVQAEPAAEGDHDGDHPRRARVVDEHL